jgi:hypothetical protein
MVANIRPRRLLRKIRREQRDSEDYGPRCYYADTEAHRLGAEDPAAYALHVIDSWLNRSNDETGTHQHLPRTPITSIFGLVWIFSRPLRQTKGLFCGRFGLATNYGSASNWAPLFRLAWAHMQAARPDQLDRLYPRGLNQHQLAPAGISYRGSWRRRSGKAWRPSERTARKKRKSLNPPQRV